MQLFKTDEYEYSYLYGGLPKTQEECIEYLYKNTKLTPLDLVELEKEVNQIEWEEKEFTFFIVPRGTPRPRSGAGHFYVKNAAHTKKFFTKCLRDEGIICTRVELSLDVYLPTPVTSMNNKEIILAEKGLIRPLVTPDFDNLAKTYTDALQGIILLNDNIICSGRVEKYYSIKPRIKLLLRYQKGFDSKYNKKKTITSVGYQKLLKDGDLDA